MGDVAVVAAITGGASAIASGFTGLATWASAQTSSNAEKNRTEAETRRVRIGHQEEERRHRQSTYHEFLDVLIVTSQKLGVPTTDKERLDLFPRYNHLLAGVLLFGSPPVRDATYALNSIYESIWPRFEEMIDQNPDTDEALNWQRVTADLLDNFSDAMSLLVQRMNDDVTSQITDTEN